MSVYYQKRQSSSERDVLTNGIDWPSITFETPTKYVVELTLAGEDENKRHYCKENYLDRAIYWVFVTGRHVSSFDVHMPDLSTQPIGWIGFSYNQVGDNESPQIRAFFVEKGLKDSNVYAQIDYFYPFKYWETPYPLPPSLRKNGIGGGILAEVVKVCEKSSVAIYCQSDDELQNVLRKKRFGFGEFDIDGHNHFLRIFRKEEVSDAKTIAKNNEAKPYVNARHRYVD